MSAGTRKKFVDFHKILEDKVNLFTYYFKIIDYNSDSENFDTKRKKISSKNKKKFKLYNSKEKLLNKKRFKDKDKDKETITVKSENSLVGKTRFLNPRPCKGLKKNKIGNSNSSMVKNENLTTNYFGSSNYSDSVNNDGIPLNSYNSNKSKILNKKSTHVLYKKEFNDIISQHEMEYESIGIKLKIKNNDLTESENENANESHNDNDDGNDNRESKTNINEINKIRNNSNDNKSSNSLISDFTYLNMNLFEFTKFENSKPYKMIDYILNNDNNFLTSQNDKDKFEEIKKCVFNKSKLLLKENSTSVFKSLYQFFKTDFSESVLMKIFEKLNYTLHELFKGETNDDSFNNISQIDKDNSSTVNLNLDKKDKFTYQNYLMDRLKNISCSSSNLNSNDLLKEIHNVEIMKSLIYLNNKGNKTPYKNIKNKSDQSFLSTLKDNLEILKNAQPELVGNKTNDMLIEKLSKNRKFMSFVKRKLMKLFCLRKNKIFNEDVNLNSDTKKKLLHKLFELFIKHKEDDYEKIIKGLKKFETSSIVNKQGAVNNNTGGNTSSTGDIYLPYYKDIKSLWSGFRFLFYLNSLNSTEGGEYITDDKFWQIFLNYFNTHGNLPQNLTQKKKLTNSGRKKNNARNNLNNNNDVDVSSPSLDSKMKINEKVVNLQEIKLEPFNILSPKSIGKKEKNNTPLKLAKSLDIESESILNLNNTVALGDRNQSTIVNSIDEIKKKLLTKLNNGEEIFKIIKTDLIPNSFSIPITTTPAPEKKIRKIRTSSTKKPKIIIPIESDIIMTSQENLELININKSKTQSIMPSSDNEDKIPLIKPKTVRPNPGFNASGNIIINNYYNIINQNITDPLAKNLVDNMSLSHTQTHTQAQFATATLVPESKKKLIKIQKDNIIISIDGENKNEMGDKEKKGKKIGNNIIK
jgi:hypothetical protein